MTKIAEVANIREFLFAKEHVQTLFCDCVVNVYIVHVIKTNFSSGLFLFISVKPCYEMLTKVHDSDIAISLCWKFIGRKRIAIMKIVLLSSCCTSSWSPNNLRDEDTKLHVYLGTSAPRTE